MGIEFLKDYERMVNQGIVKAMERIRQKDESGSVMAEGMEYALLAGGKRIRPAFCLMGARIAGLDQDRALDFAVAIEFIHTYSLVHDDLPGMDDDDLRRGQPTCHIRYGEGEAILIGDALLTHGIGLMLEPVEGVSPERQLKAVRAMVDAIGVNGMIGGQAADILLESSGEGGEAALKYIHRHKTGSLLTASLLSGAILGGLEEAGLEKLKEYGEAFGLAFQITDDILDQISTTEELGKPIGSDEKNAKLTYPSLYGLERSREMAAYEVERCRKAAAGFGATGEQLSGLAGYLLERRK